jgi:hypothetical protein
MAIQQPHCSKQAFARRGDDSYEAHLCLKVEADNHVGIVAIDFEVDAGAIMACVGFRQNSDAPV